MPNWAAILILLAIAAGIIAALKYSQLQQQKRQTTRTDEELTAYRVILMQSPDNELSPEDAEFVRLLFTPALIGQYEKRHRPIIRQLRRLDNAFQQRAIGIRLVERWQQANPNTPQQQMPPELREIAAQERAFAPALTQTQQEEPSS